MCFWFYNHLILSGTKIKMQARKKDKEFYNHLILSGTKIDNISMSLVNGFTIT